MEVMRTFYFNTGVRPWAHNPPVRVGEGQVIRNGTLQIPFDCEDVPEGAIFEFACDHTPPGRGEYLLKREMHNTTMCSKYAFFLVPNYAKQPA